MDDEVMGENHEHRDDAQQLDTGVSPLPICDSGMRRCAVFGAHTAVVLRGLVLLAHNSPLVCGLSSLPRILRTQTDWDILRKDKIEQMFECVVCCR